jgi:hypothetical protein
VTDTLNFTPSGLYEVFEAQPPFKEEEMEKQAYRLNLTCVCGQKVIPRSLMISDQKELMVRTYCPACKSIVMVLFNLETLLESCPPVSEPLEPMVQVEFSPLDISLLAEMHISLQEGGDPSAT